MAKDGWLSGFISKWRGGGAAPARSRAPASRPAGATPAPVLAARPAASPPHAPTRIQASAFLRQRIRDRYLGSRFPGVPHGAAELAQTDQVIKTARLFFEDGDLDRACEWLAFASDANPDERLWLAQLEMRYLKRQAASFTSLAADFRKRFPDSTHWSEVARLGARVAPGEALYAGAADTDGDTHYGPWPQARNWIEAPFDLTNDVLAGEFHSAMQGGGLAPLTARGG